MTATAQRVVTDPGTLKVVIANTVSVQAIESLHNTRLDSINQKKSKIMAYTSGMAAIRELYQMSMTNIRGFGSESKYYLEIGTCALEIARAVPEALSAINASRLPGKVRVIKELANIEMKAAQLVKDFVNICNNGRIDNPLKKGEKPHGDGYNFLDRNARLTVAHRIYADLSAMRSRLQMIQYYVAVCGWGDVLLTYAPADWAKLSTMKAASQSIITQWNRLK